MHRERGRNWVRRRVEGNEFKNRMVDGGIEQARIQELISLVEPASQFLKSTLFFIYFEFLGIAADICTDLCLY